MARTRAKTRQTAALEYRSGGYTGGSAAGEEGEIIRPTAAIGSRSRHIPKNPGHPHRARSGDPAHGGG